MNGMIRISWICLCRSAGWCCTNSNYKTMKRKIDGTTMVPHKAPKPDVNDTIFHISMMDSTLFDIQMKGPGPHKVWDVMKHVQKQEGIPVLDQQMHIPRTGMELSIVGVLDSADVSAEHPIQLLVDPVRRHGRLTSYKDLDQVLKGVERRIHMNDGYNSDEDEDDETKPPALLWTEYCRGSGFHSTAEFARWILGPMYRGGYARGQDYLPLRHSLAESFLDFRSTLAHPTRNFRNILGRQETDQHWYEGSDTLFPRSGSHMLSNDEFVHYYYGTYEGTAGIFLVSDTYGYSQIREEFVKLWMFDKSSKLWMSPLGFGRFDHIPIAPTDHSIQYGYYGTDHCCDIHRDCISILFVPTPPTPADPRLEHTLVHWCHDQLRQGEVYGSYGSENWLYDTSASTFTPMTVFRLERYSVVDLHRDSRYDTNEEDDDDDDAQQTHTMVVNGRSVEVVKCRRCNEMYSNLGQLRPRLQTVDEDGISSDFRDTMRDALLPAYAESEQGKAEFSDSGMAFKEDLHQKRMLLPLYYQPGGVSVVTLVQRRWRKKMHDDTKTGDNPSR